LVSKWKIIQILKKERLIIIVKYILNYKYLKYNNIYMIFDKGFNNIDIVYYINLDHRTDRLENINNELNKTNIDKNKINRIAGVYNKEYGFIGCSQSHYNALSKFIESDINNKNCLILEDDFEFTVNQDEIDKMLNYVFNNIHFDILMLSSNTFESKNTTHSYIDKILNAQTASGYIVNRRFAKILLNNYQEGLTLLNKSKNPPDHAIDIYWKKLQPIFNWYCLNPKIGKQMENYSDIEKKKVNYKL